MTVASVQAAQVGAQIVANKGRLIDRTREVEAALVYGPETNPVEQALMDLGALIGLVASRPDREHGKGPDVLWRYPEDATGAALEAKTNKQATSQYKKRDDIGQFHDHLQWLVEKHPTERFAKYIVGPRLRVSGDANPPADLRVIQLAEFQDLVCRLRELYEYVESTTTGTDTGYRTLRRTRPPDFGSRMAELSGGTRVRPRSAAGIGAFGRALST